MTEAEDERAIRELVDTWMTATKAGDIATVLDLMTDDILFMVPGQMPFGKSEFAAGSEGMKDLRVEGSAKIEELRVMGQWAYIRNYIDITITLPGGGPPMHKAGYTLSILRKEEEGRWRLTRDANLVMDQA